MDESAARKLIVEVGKLLYERSHVVAFDGNVSIRLDENTVLATPTMTSKGRMTEDCLALRRYFDLPTCRELFQTC